MVVVDETNLGTGHMRKLPVTLVRRFRRPRNNVCWLAHPNSFRKRGGGGGVGMHAYFFALNRKNVV